MSSIQLRVMTFNIRLINETDEGNLWRDRRSIVADLLRTYDADIIGMQEAYRTQLAQILIDSGEYSAVGRERRGGTDEEHNPILLRSSQFLVEESGTFWLSDTPDVAGSRQWMPEDHPRVVTWARVMDLNSATRLLLLNTHFPLGSDELRARCARLLADRLRGIEPMPTVLTGDFNSRPDSEPYRVLTGSDASSDVSRVSFDDAWTLSPENAGPEETVHGFAGRAKRPGSRIDWILVGNGVRVLRMEVSTMNCEGCYPSDHFPVFADIEVNAVAEGL